jgi:hypothetical protein
MPSVIADLCGATARWALTGVVVWMVSVGIIPAGQSGSYVERLTSATLAGLAMLAPLAWSYRQKLVAAVKAEAARRAGHNATAWEVGEQAKHIDMLEVLTQSTTKRELLQLRTDLNEVKKQIAVVFPRTVATIEEGTHHDG